MAAVIKIQVNYSDDGADKVKKTIEGLGEGATKAGSGFNALQQAATGAMRQVGAVVVDAAGQAAQAFAAFVTGSVSKAADFEGGMNSFAAVVGDSLDESGQSLDQFKDLFISLGRELPVSTADVQKAAIEMAKGGIEPATIAAGGLRQTLQFAAAAGLSLEQAATIAAKAVGGWTDVNATAAQKADFLAHSTDLLARAANASTVDVDELALGLYNSQGAARAAGVSFDDTVTTLAAVASSFASSATAGTSFSNFIARIQPTTAPAADAMKKLGLLTAEGTSKFYDAQGSFIGMQKAAELLKNATQDLSAAERSSTLQTIFGNDAKGVAVKLAELGAEGYDAMAASMAKQAGVAEQAAMKQQGFNVSMDNLQGSLEALQITIGSAALPLLTKLINVVAGGVNAVTEYADATIAGTTALATVGSVIKDAALPALAALTTATIVYGATALAPMLVNLPAMTAVLIYNTTAMLANAAAVALAAAPLVVLAAAVAGVVLVWNKFNDAVTSASAQLLESRKWWTDAGTAVQNYGTQTGQAAEALKPYAATVQAIRDQIQGEVESLGKRAAAGLITNAQYQSEMDMINQHRQGLIQATEAYNQQEQAIVKASAASMTATNALPALTSNTALLGNQASLTAKDVEDLGNKIQKTYADGQAAVQAYASTQADFLTGIETRQADHKAKIVALEAEKQSATTTEARKGIDDKIAAENEGYQRAEEAAADSYARQQAQQQQHLGQMLIDYTVAQAQLGNIAKDKAAQITAALEQEYGLQESSVASTFLHMAGSIDDFANSSGGSINNLIGDLHSQQRAAAETQKAMDDYAHEYTATAVSNFLSAKGDAQSYIDSLESIPRRVSTEVVTHYSHTGDRPGEGRDDASTPGRAAGGPVVAGAAYVVGERGPELFVPDRNGSIVSNRSSSTSFTYAPTINTNGGVNQGLDYATARALAGV